ncbi:MAG: hypothetical protein JNJ63_10115 [Hyphomonadaceae bacterium]|nr:hypothetical protein [Hyphomonadaceae bacterium]
MAAPHEGPELMDQTRFEAIVAAYGADPKRWPEAERDAAIAYAAAHAVDLSEARAIDALLGAAPPIAPPGDLLVARIARSRRQNLLAPLAALAACAVMGVIFGYGAGLSAPAQVNAENSDIEQVLSAAFDAPASAWSSEDS